MTQQLPERANLEQLKKQAKTLLQAARELEPDAIARFAEVPHLARSIEDRTLALHDAQFVIAREYGFRSWNDLREHVEERSLSFEGAVDEFLRCATGNARGRAERILGRHPRIARANLYTELVLGDWEGVSRRVGEGATEPGGPLKWAPLLYVCQTCLHRDSPARADGLVKIARELLRLGADPNGEYHWDWHPELPRTVLWGALVAMGHFPLAEVLLEAGANPTDGVSMHIAAGSDNLAALDLLGRFGADANGIAGGVPPLRYILGWAPPEGPADGARWLLEHGADPNLEWAETGDAALHVAAERWHVRMVELLVSHGADIHQRTRDGRTAHTIAATHGNTEIAAWLLEHGAANELTPVDQFVAVCARGDRERAEAMLAARPGLRSELTAEHHRKLHVPAERGDAAVLATMLDCGFDPGVRTRDGVPALHRAAMAGRVDAARLLIAAGARVDDLDGMFASTPLVWACEGWSHAQGSKPGVDHVGVARVLLEAGSPRDWAAPEKAPHVERTQELLIELCRAADASPGQG